MGVRTGGNRGKVISKGAEKWGEIKFAAEVAAAAEESRWQE